MSLQLVEPTFFLIKCVAFTVSQLCPREIILPTRLNFAFISLQLLYHYSLCMEGNKTFLCHLRNVSLMGLLRNSFPCSCWVTVIGLVGPPLGVVSFGWYTGRLV